MPITGFLTSAKGGSLSGLSDRFNGLQMKLHIGFKRIRRRESL
jgi:hypothetical protein